MKGHLFVVSSMVVSVLTHAFVVQSEAAVQAEEFQSIVVAPASSIQNMQNNRMKTLEGSTSRWSGQLNMTYSGSSVSTPFSGEVPNPGNQVPPPLATLSSSLSGRYRMDDQTTVGIGAGVTTQTPFQGPKNTTIADPYLDIARTFKWGSVKNRADFQTTLWTNSQYYDAYGYRLGFTLVNESYYQFPFGLTTGLAFQFDYNLFASGDQYDESQRTQFDFYINPYFEMTLSKKVNLRTVIGIASIHTANLSGALTLIHPDVYQTFGVGMSLAEAVFLYPYMQFFPFSGKITAQSTLIGFNAILNVF